MKFSLPLSLAALAVILLLPGQPAVADVVKMTNGDTLHGKVVSLTADKLTIQSDVLGKLELPRKRIAMIALGEDAKFETPSQPAAAAQPKMAPETGTAADALRQLQEQGISREQMSALRKEMPMLALPQAKSYFDQTVTGLMSGEIDLSKVRKDAIKARDELELLKKDLGPNGHMLNGYLGILNNFIAETDPPAEQQKPAEKPEQKK